MNIRPGIGAWAFALACAISASAARAGSPLEETAGVLLVCSSGPSATLARAERLRGAAELTASGILPNPALTATHQRALTGPTDTETVIGVSVPLGLSGRRGVLLDAARVRREQGEAIAHATLLEAALAFREAYVEALLDQARADVATQQQAHLDRLSATIKGLEKRGEAAGYDILRQETQAKLHRRSLELLRARAARSRAQLSAWTGTEVTLPQVPLSALAGGAQAGQDSLASPRLRGLALEAKAALLEAKAARRRWVPELEVFAGYRATGTETETGHGISLGITVPLTLFDHGQGEAARAEAAAAVADAQGSVARREQQAELRSSLTALALLQPGVAEAEQVVRDAIEVQARAEQLYAAGEASITELLEAFRSAEEAQLALVALREEIAHVRLAIMRARGSLLDPNLDKRCGAVHAGEVP